jgi:hypothetical protein
MPKSGMNGFQGVIHYGKRWEEGVGWLRSRERWTAAEVKGIDFNSLCSVATSGEVKTVGSGSVEDFMGQAWGDDNLLSWQSELTLGLLDAITKNRQLFQDLAIHPIRDKL